MRYLHSSTIKVHGFLTSKNCVVDGRWVLKVTNYGFRETITIYNLNIDRKSEGEPFWKCRQNVCLFVCKKDERAVSNLFAVPPNCFSYKLSLSIELRVARQTLLVEAKETIAALSRRRKLIHNWSRSFLAKLRMPQCLCIVGAIVVENYDCSGQSFAWSLLLLRPRNCYILRFFDFCKIRSSIRRWLCFSIQHVVIKKLGVIFLISSSESILCTS